MSIMKLPSANKAAAAHDLAAFFDDATLQRGVRYALEDRAFIDEVRGESGGALAVVGSVRGSKSRPYMVDVWLMVESGSGAFLAVEGECDCPVGYNCKHVVALLLTALARSAEKAAEDAAPPAPAEPEFDPSPAALSWLASLDPPAAAEPVTGTHRVVYKLDPARGVMFVGKSRCLKKGGLGKPAPWMPYAHDVRGAGKDFVRPEDVPVLRLALACQEEVRYYQRELIALLEGESGFILLRAAARTGRLFAGEAMEQPLRWGETRAHPLAWRRDPRGQQRLAFDLPGTLQRLPTWPPAYFDPATAEVGELNSGLPDDVVAKIMRAPPLNEGDALIVRQRLTAIGRTRKIDLPLPQARAVLAPSGPPMPRLHLRRGRIRHQQIPAMVDEIALAELYFDYPGLPPVLAAETPPPMMQVQLDGEKQMLARDVEAEAAAWRLLQAQGLESLQRRQPSYLRSDTAGDCLLPLHQDAVGWLPLLGEGRARLEAAGFSVTIADDFPYQLANAEDWFVDVEEERGGDWFNLDLGVMIGGERVSLVPPLVRLIAAQPRLLARLNDMAETDSVPVALDERRILPVPVPRLRAWLLPLLEFLDHTQRDGRPRLSRHHAAVLATLAEMPAHWMGGERLRGIGARLKDFSGIAAVPPAPTFRTELRHYQQEGLNWLQFLREYDLAGILADDMGLGKTVQTLAHLQLEKLSGRADRPSLVVAPTSLMANWRNEAAQFTPELKVLTLHGTDRFERFGDIAGADIVLTTYPLLVRDQETLLAQPYHLLIMDEAQFIKNPKAKSHHVARKLVARHRLSLTGTPLENHLGELWAHFDFLMPGFLGTADRFGRVFRAPIEKQGDPAARQGLAERVRPFLLRRTKEQVLTELPPRTEIVRWVEIEGGQRDLYESLRVAFDRKLRDVLKEKGVGQSQIMILDALLKLRQVCCDPRLVKLESAQAVVRKGHAGSAKLALLMEMLEELLDEGRRILLFSQFTSMLALIEAELEKKGIRYAKLTGQTRLREGPIADFQEGRVPLFLVSLKAGGTGLNLTAADTVIHYDPWWNPAVEEQATSRAHRMGQDKPVFVYKLMTQGTVEEKILALQSRKRGLADQLVKGDASGRHLLGADDLDVLFQPLG